MIASIKNNIGFREEIDWLYEQRVREARSLRQFAEDELVIPDGPYKGDHFDCSVQPYTGILLDEIDRGDYRDVVIVGPTQTGKTYLGLCVPAMYHLFEIGETIIIGVPDMNMVADKWSIDLLPSIEASFPHMLPRRGPGSRGGVVKSKITFRNGAILKFMTAGGGDKGRAGFTSRVAVVTEVDGFEQQRAVSYEADKIEQLLIRTKSYRGRRIHYLECTTTIPEGQIWKRYEAGTKSQLVCKCIHCKNWVSPEREHLVGWNDAKNIIEAGQLSRFACPVCGADINEDERFEMNQNLKLIHGGQEITKRGKITGEAKPTNTLGFRWSAFQNMFTSIDDLGREEYSASQELDEDNAERKMCQFVWAVPYIAPEISVRKYDTAESICQRITGVSRGNIPVGMETLSMGIDIGLYWGHWNLAAWNDDASMHIADYDMFDIPSQSFTGEQAVLLSLRKMRDETIEPGWLTSDGTKKPPGLILIDTRYLGEAVIQFCKESPDRYLAFRGFSTNYHHPKRINRDVRFIGDNYCIRVERKNGTHHLELHANVDYWKSFVHERMGTNIEAPGALTLFHDDNPERKHRKYAQHLLSEKLVPEFQQGRIGMRNVWKKFSKNNHWFDTTVYSAIAAHYLGVRAVRGTNDASMMRLQKRNQHRRQEHHRGLKTPDGRPFLVTER